MQSRSIALMVLAALCTAPVMADEAKAPIGKKIESFTLNDFHGQPYSLDRYARGKAVVLAFLGTECPLCKIYAPRLVALSKQYAAQDVVFLGIDPNRQDSATEIAAYARNHGIEFPILKDLKQVIADDVGVTRTPEVVVLDADRKIRYRGRIDDQYGFQKNVGYQQPSARAHDLVAALDAITAGEAVATTETNAPGCLIGRDLEPVVDSDVTYCNQIVRILNHNCVFCHREGQIAPFTLTEYEDVAGWASMIEEVVLQQRMPPWHANEQFGHFKNDARLSKEDKATISKWVANGAPQGDPSDLPQPPEFAEGWMISEPDEVVYMSKEPYKVPANGVVDYQYFTVDPGWTEDKWITEIEPRPGNPAIVHHILLFVFPPDGNLNDGIGGGNDFLGAFAPGLRPEPLTGGLARYVPAGSKLIFQMHYTPNGSPQEDLSYCGFVFTDPAEVSREVRVTSAINAVFEIPPHNEDFPVSARYIFTEDSLLLTLMPHMHLRGKAFRYEATYPDGRKEVLLDVPRYDFGWQTNYRLAEPKLMPRGTRMDCYARFDNSEDNLNNPDPEVAVRFGDQTFDEMMIGFFEAAPAEENLQDPTAKRKPLSRVDKFNIIMAATGGEPDDNVKVAAFLALADPDIFDDFSSILRTMVPQVDRVCVTAVTDGKVVEVIGPFTADAHHGHHDHAKKDHDDDDTEAEIRKQVAEAQEKSGLAKRRLILMPLSPSDAKGEALADYAAGSKVVVNNDLANVPGKLIEEMVARGAKSSMHVPAEIKGQRVTINFWSRDANAFPPAAEAVLTGVARIMTAPKDNAQATAE